MPSTEKDASVPASFCLVLFVDVLSIADNPEPAGLSVAVILRAFSLPLDDNIIYVNGVNYSHIHTECSIDDSIAYCGSFVLWILGNNHRLPQNLFAAIRSHRIFPKNIWEALDEL